MEKEEIWQENVMVDDNDNLWLFRLHSQDFLII